MISGLMMTMRLVSLFVLAMTATAMADNIKRFGNWEVSYIQGRFGDKGKVIASVVQDGTVLAIRCMNGDLSFALLDIDMGPGRFREQGDITAKFQADGKSPVDVKGMVLTDKTLQIEMPDTVARQLIGTKELAFRVTYLKTTFDRVFKPGKSGPKAMSEVFKLCPLPEIK